jgi:hypothetical protein
MMKTEGATSVPSCFVFARNLLVVVVPSSCVSGLCKGLPTGSFFADMFVEDCRLLDFKV